MNGLALFAGVGGLDLGIQLCIPSSRTVCFVEREAYAAAVLRAKMEEGRLHKAAIWSDVTTFDGTPFVGKVHYISAGFPCQPWSIAGKQKGTEDERWLWGDIKRIICEVRPSFLFLENVPGIINGGIDPILRDLAEIGFNVEWGMLKASSVGASHHRNRFFLFAYCAERGCNLSHSFSDGLFSRWNYGSQGSEGEFSEGGLERDKPPVMCETLSDSNISGVKKFTISDFQREEIPDIIGTCSDVPHSRRKPGQIQTQRKFSSLKIPKCPSWWKVEPSVGRVVNGLAHRVDRLRACGNGVVPLQAAVAYSILIERAIKGGGLNAN